MKNKIDFTPWLCSWPSSSEQAQGFPIRFWPKWKLTYAKEPMLHLFCGASTDGYTRVDIRSESKANLIGDFRDVKLDAIYNSAFADPPYTQEFADEWNTKFPKPSEILKVMLSACLPKAYIGILHLQVIRPIKGLSKVAWHPVFCGTTKHIRCLSVFQVE